MYINNKDLNKIAKSYLNISSFAITEKSLKSAHPSILRFCVSKKRIKELIQFYNRKFTVTINTFTFSLTTCKRVTKVIGALKFLANIGFTLLGNC